MFQFPEITSAQAAYPSTQSINQLNQSINHLKLKPISRVHQCSSMTLYRKPMIFYVEFIRKYKRNVQYKMCCFYQQKECGKISCKNPSC